MQERIKTINLAESPDSIENIRVETIKLGVFLGLNENDQFLINHLSEFTEKYRLSFLKALARFAVNENIIKLSLIRNQGFSSTTGSERSFSIHLRTKVGAFVASSEFPISDFYEEAVIKIIDSLDAQIRGIKEQIKARVDAYTNPEYFDY